ncbi:baseplate assembly protein [Sphingomonas sp.]|uniref:baseplate assembly protein n=1 Tax=Sphingomonas sp. TaxID=28214 RepID=UPI003B3B57BD
MAAYTAVDLSRLPAPAIVEELDFDTIYADMRARLLALLPDFDATVESDPAVKILQVAAYSELLIRARINDAARSLMVAYATGADLDNLAALFGVARFLIDAGDPQHGLAPTYESDADLRRRLVLAPEGYSVAGPVGAYIFHALSADADVLDASVASPTPGRVVVTVLSRTGDGTAPPALVDAVAAYCSADTRRPITDEVIVQGAAIVPFAVTATLTFFPGPDAAIVTATAQARLADYLAESHRLGRDITRSGLFAALHVEGVQNVTLVSPAADLVIADHQAAWCTGVTLTSGGTAE